MHDQSRSFDVVVFGAGTTGAALAAMLAQGGRSVALVERRPLDAAGARWINDVPPWLFDAARIERPRPPEKRCDHVPVAMLGGDGGRAVELGRRPMWGVDCRALGARLRGDAVAAGVAVVDRAELAVVEFDGERPAAVTLAPRGAAAGAARRLEAALFVDASGVAGALRRRLPAFAACRPPRPGELASAAQQVCRVADRAGARAFLARHGAAEGEVLNWSGVRGAYSTLVVRVEPGLEAVELLTGVACSVDAKGGPSLLAHFKHGERWIGAVDFGGAGVIPIRRPYDRLVAPGAALVGDAACQAFPAHGSGIGAGLVAARTLADALAGAPDPGDEAALWRYAVRFQRGVGGVHAAYDVLRRLVVGLEGREIRSLFDAGVIAPRMVEAGLEQQMPAWHPGALLGPLAGALRQPALAARLLARTPRMLAARAVYRAYPAVPGGRALGVWSRVAALASGLARDVRPGSADPDDDGHRGVARGAAREQAPSTARLDELLDELDEQA